MSGKFIPLLIAASPRLLGQAFAPVAVVSSISFKRNLFHSGHPSSFPNPTATCLHIANESDKENNNMTDEVAAAKEAAAQYKSSENDGAGPATAFDKILSGEWASKKVHEDDLAYAFRDINPQAPVHIIVIPKHRDGLTKLSNAREDQKGILGHLMYVAQMVGKKECPNGFRVVINDGEEGAQSVYHLHLHVLGGRQMKWPPG